MEDYLQKRDRDIHRLMLWTLLIVFGLFFIDEGYYDLRWMRDGGNWIVFVVYFLIILSAQLFFHFVVLKGYNKKRKMLISVVAGSLFMLSGIVALASYLHS